MGVVSGVLALACASQEYAGDWEGTCELPEQTARITISEGELSDGYIDGGAGELEVWLVAMIATFGGEVGFEYTYAELIVCADEVGCTLPTNVGEVDPGYVQLNADNTAGQKLILQGFRDEDTISGTCFFVGTDGTSWSGPLELTEQ